MDITARARRCLCAILASGVLSTTAYAEAQPESQASGSPRVGVFLRAALGGATSFQEGRRFTTPYDTPPPLEEHGRFDARYDFGASLGADSAIRVRLYRRLAIWLGYTITRRNGTAEVDLYLPHPFYSNRTRDSRGSDDGFVFRESAVHTDLALLFRFGRLEGTLLAGVSYFMVRGNLVDDISYDYRYPYDSGDLAVDSLIQDSAQDAPLGFNCGLNLDLPIGRAVGFGLLLQYSRARAHLVPEPGSEIVINVGGPQASAGVSVYF